MTKDNTGCCRLKARQGRGCIFTPTDRACGHRSTNMLPMRSRKLRWFTLMVTVMIPMSAFAEPEADPRGNLERVIQNVEAVTGEEVVNFFAVEPGDDPKIHCVENGFCEGRIGELRIEAMGRQVEISPSPRTPPETLVGSCIGLLAAFAEEPAADEIERFVQAATARTLDGERVSIDLGSIGYQMKLTAEDLPSCKLVRYIQQ